MASLWLVDTSAWIFALRSRPFLPIQQRVDELLAEERVLLAGMVELELLAGTRTEREFRELKDLLNGLPKVETHEADWAAAALMAFRLRRAGYTVPSTEVLLACQARRAKAGILHADRDFTVLCRHFHMEQEDFSAAVAGRGDGAG